MFQSRLPLMARHTRTAGRPRRVLFGIVVLALIVSAMGAAVLPAARPAAAAAASTTDYLNLRSDASTDADVVDVMPPGASVEITGDPVNGFYPVNYNGEDGWAFGAYLDTTGGGWNAVTATTSVNLRADPSYDSAVLDVIPEGGVATLIGDGANGFISVSYNGTYGWVDMQYLDYGANSAPADNSDASQAPADNSDTSAPAPAETAPAEDNSAPPADSSANGNDIVSIIYAAADRYGQSREDMLRVATCESNLDPSAVNPSSGASGLFQFMPGTWASTPYANDDIFDAWASANAAGWMWSVGRRNEWECQ